MRKDVLEFKEKFLKLLERHDRILITSHVNPDDDSIGSVLVLEKELRREYPGKQVDIFYEGGVGERYSFLEGFKDINITKNLFEVSTNYDLVIYLDANELYRATRYFEDLGKSNIPKIRIDHHRTKTNDFDLELVDSTISSTAEILYELFFREKTKIDKESAELLFLGISGDTGSFNYITSKNCQVFSVADRLIKEGEINVEGFKAQYSKITLEVFELIKKLFMNVEVLKLGENPPFSYSYLIKEDGYSYPQIKQATNFYIDYYSKLIEGVNWGVMIYPREGGYALSMRSSVGGANVRLIAESTGKGGGHDLAAGAFSEGKTKNEVEEMLFEFLKNNKVEVIK